MSPRHLWILALGMGLLACSKNEDKPGDTGSASGDTGGEPGDTGNGGSGGEDCEVELVESTPEDGATGWYYRDPMELLFSDAARGKADISLLDAGGGEVPTELSWESEDLRVTVTPSEPLQPSSDYALQVEVCGSSTELSFSTSDYGTPLAVSHEELIGNTYVIEFGDVDFTEPEGLGGYVGMVLTDPLLVGVADATEDTLSIVAVLGTKRVTGQYEQQEGAPVWSFGESDFSEAPFFQADVDEITFAYDDVEVPVTDFHLEATFSADGTVMGEGKVTGQFDTRPIDGALGFDEGFLCDTLAGMGVSCIDCPEDGEPFCLHIRAEHIEAPLVDGLTIDTGD